MAESVPLAASGATEPPVSDVPPDDSPEEGAPPWVVALGFLKASEMQRRAGFREFADRVGTVLADERRRAASGQQLVAAVRAHIHDRAEADMDNAKRLLKSANQREAADKAKSGTYSPADKADAGYLSEMLRHCAQIMEDGAKAFKSALEGSPTFTRWEALDKSTGKELAGVEQALKAAEMCETKRSKLWEKHEAACRKKMSLSIRRTTESASSMSIKFGDLWTTEIEYRLGVAQFDREVATLASLVVGMQRALQGNDIEHRTLAKLMLRDVTKCVATGYQKVADTLVLPSGNRLPSLSANGVAPVQTDNVEAPPIVTPEFPQLPPTILVLHQGPIQRPPKTMFTFKSYEPAHLLVTVDGYVHCFSDRSDVGVKSPAWSLSPKPGSLLAIDHAASKMMFSPPGGWAPQVWNRRKVRTCKLQNGEQLDAWERVLRLWWPAPSSSQMEEVSGSAADVAGECDEEDDEASEARAAMETAADTQEAMEVASAAAKALDTMASADFGEPGDIDAAGVAAKSSDAMVGAELEDAGNSKVVQSGTSQVPADGEASSDMASATAETPSSAAQEEATASKGFDPPPRIPTGSSPEIAEALVPETIEPFK